MIEMLENAIDSLGPAAASLFAEIGTASRDDIGITRDAFGDRETAAAEILLRFAREHDLAAGYDRVGNLGIALADAETVGPEVLIGSHLDSVPRGGNFDGLAGIIAGTVILAALRRARLSPPCPLRVLGFRGEESPWFGTAYLGSKLFLGLLGRPEIDNLRRFDTGRSLADHLRGIGVDPDDARLGAPQIAIDRIQAYLELHIEQGPLLEDINCPIGIAKAIRGNIRYPFAKCYGHYAHSGAVPRHLRSDAVLATAKLLAFADERWRRLIMDGNDDLVFTCGIFQTDAAEHAMTKVSGELVFTLNIGATSDAVMDALHDDLMARATELAAEHNVRFAFGTRVGTPAVALDRTIADRAAAAGGKLGIPVHVMPTVGHDAAMFARSGVPTGMVLVRNSHGSHNPAENMAIADFMLGVKILAATALMS